MSLNGGISTSEAIRELYIKQKFFVFFFLILLSPLHGIFKSSISLERVELVRGRVSNKDVEIGNDLGMVLLVWTLLVETCLKFLETNYFICSFFIEVNYSQKN